MERDYSIRCSKCGERAVSLAIVPYHGQTYNDGRLYDIHIPDLVVPRCEKCGNIVLHDDANSRITEALRKLAGLLTPEEIHHRREQLGYSQADLAEKLGITTVTLAGWESGMLIQQRSLDRFLRAFFCSPELRKTLADQQALELCNVE